MGIILNAVSNPPLIATCGLDSKLFYALSIGIDFVFNPMSNPHSFMKPTSIPFMILLIALDSTSIKPLGQIHFAFSHPKWIPPQLFMMGGFDTDFAGWVDSTAV